eukprot:CAMPEP_0181180044 /NCGR_PEP_ID=MMETSP1096-20121128/6587_1 /TAXON_ID=156174 ORGANISM="Chrysochromulina ericina, Strain CCMP281" /NCGR_SAMPLE_ID=MMETSP1096 /ASSEMBLY_ACC=CAM_ASM_000453 /LENGTH=31 /DNA_ID= /DNA_START= /DNA_END= /DNA_ORIENTATION=
MPHAASIAHHTGMARAGSGNAESARRRPVRR